MAQEMCEDCKKSIEEIPESLRANVTMVSCSNGCVVYLGERPDPPFQVDPDPVDWWMGAKVGCPA